MINMKSYNAVLFFTNCVKENNVTVEIKFTSDIGM